MADSYGKSDPEWSELLTPEQYEVCRHKGTERAFTGQYWDCKETGVYRCVCCGSELFSSEADRKSTRLNSSHIQKSRMPSSA